MGWSAIFELLDDDPISDLLWGQRVTTLVDEIKSAGYYAASFNAAECSIGLYFHKMSAGEVSYLKKMMLVK